MADFAQAAVDTTQATTSDSSHTVGDALKAYQVVSTAENARQQLDIQKQENERNKATWLSSQVDAINKLNGPGRQVVADGFASQFQKVYPNANQDLPKLLAKDPELTRDMSTAMSHIANGTAGPEDYEKLNSVLGSSSPQLISFIEQGAKNRATVESGQIKASAQLGRVEEIKNGAATAAGHAFEADPIILNSKKNLNSIEKSQSILNDPKAPVTGKAFNLAYNDYINATAPGGAATEGKVNRELPETFATQWNTLQQKLGDNADLRKDPQGKALIDILKQNISTVRRDMKSQISDQAKSLHSNYQSTSNEKVKQVADSKLKQYTAPDPAEAKPKTVIQNGHTYNLNPATGQYE